MVLFTEFRIGEMNFALAMFSVRWQVDIPRVMPDRQIGTIVWSSVIPGDINLGVITCIYLLLCIGLQDYLQVWWPPRWTQSCDLLQPEHIRQNQHRGKVHVVKDRGL
jgi:hypothetical protein